MSKYIFACEKLTIKEVFNRGGKFFDTYRLIGSNYDRVLNLRRFSQAQVSLYKKTGDENLPFFRCGECARPVYLSAYKDGETFYFKHLGKDDSICDWKTDSELSKKEICAKRYNNSKESPAHKELKKLIRESLEADPRFSEIKEEKWVRSKHDNSYRRPDIQAVYNGKIVAFEAQVSTEFMHVILERIAFYKDEGLLVVWILSRIDKRDQRIMQDDLMAMNNYNILIANKHTRDLSVQSSKFHLDCHWAIPEIERSNRKFAFQSKVVDFGELTINQQKQQAYYFDYSKELRVLQAKRNVCKQREWIAEKYPAKYPERYVENLELNKSFLDALKRNQEFNLDVLTAINRVAPQF